MKVCLLIPFSIFFEVSVAKTKTYSQVSSYIPDIVKVRYRTSAIKVRKSGTAG